ncbi:MAG: HAD-IA family hydrolase [Cellvibrionaceae bacterium]
MLYIFDWDGTLCDSLNKIVTCTQLAAEEMGMEKPTDDAVKNIIGLSLPKAIDRVFPGITESELKQLLEIYSKYFRADKANVMDFYPGVRSTLDSLLEAGHHIAVATGKSRQGLDRVFTDLDMVDYFHGSRCADETKSKPHPLMLEELLDEFGVDAQDAIMIGDTEYDMDMAKQIDMPRIAVSYGAHAIERLVPFDPILCVDQIDQILTLK